MANPFQNAFTNYENSTDKSALGDASTGGFNPNEVQNNNAPWTPPNPAAPPKTAGAIPTQAFGSYGTGNEAPLNRPAPAQPTATPATGSGNPWDTLRGAIKQAGNNKPWSGGGIQSPQLGPVLGDPGQMPPEVAAAAPMTGSFSAARGGAIPAFDDGGSVADGGASGGYYSGSSSSMDNTGGGDNYTVDLSQALGDVQQTLQAARDQASPSNTEGYSPAPAADAASFEGADAPAPAPAQGAVDKLQSAGVSSSNIQDNRNQPPAPEPAPNTVNIPSPLNPNAWRQLGYAGRQLISPLQVGPDGTSPELSNMTRGFADGGSVESDVPDTPDSGASAAPSAIPDPSVDTTGDPSAAPTDDQTGLMRYASGADAVSPDVAAAAEQAVDPQGQMDPAERRIRAIAAAQDQQTKIGLLQANRKAFNAKRHAARAALDRGNHQEAVRQANAAMSHVLNGHSYHISPNGNQGVHVHIRNMVGGQ